MAARVVSERWDARATVRMFSSLQRCGAAVRSNVCVAELIISPCLACPPLPLQVYQTVVRQLGPDHPGYIDAVVALAEQHRELGQAAEADR